MELLADVCVSVAVSRYACLIPAKALSDSGIARDDGDGNGAKEDVLLMRRVVAGDPVAFDLIYRRLSRRLQGVAVLVCHNRADAADIVHDVFLTLWKCANLFDASRGGVFPWLAVITRNRAIDLVRSRQRQFALLCKFHASTSQGVGPLDSRADRDVTIEDDHLAVRSAVARLPRKMKDALKLIYFDRRTHEDAASHLREPVGTVKSRIRRGIQRLRRGAVFGRLNSA